MRRLFAFFSAALFCFVLTLAISYTTRTVKAQNPDRCNPCVAQCGAHQDQCYAIHGFDEIRCGDQFNECIVRCYREFCEQ